MKSLSSLLGFLGSIMLAIITILIVIGVGVYPPPAPVTSTPISFNMTSITWSLSTYQQSTYTPHSYVASWQSLLTAMPIFGIYLDTQLVIGLVIGLVFFGQFILVKVLSKR